MKNRVDFQYDSIIKFCLHDVIFLLVIHQTRKLEQVIENIPHHLPTFSMSHLQIYAFK